MNLPERLYYPLPEAAEKLGCTIKDIIHFGAIGAISISVYVEYHYADEKTYFHLNIPSEKISEIDDFNSLSGNGWSIGHIEFKKVKEGFMIDGYYAKTINGFFYINSESLISAEFSNDELIPLSSVSTGPEPFEDGCIDIDFLILNSLSINLNKLCIRSVDLNNIKILGRMPDVVSSAGFESQKTIAKKENLIKALLTLVPEFSDVDIERLAVSKIKNIAEVAASARGIDFPKTDLGTWSKYLERGRHKK